MLTTPAAYRSLNILVVDDNEVQRRLFKHILERRDSHNVILAEDGAEAVRRIIAGEQFDVIVVR